MLFFNIFAFFINFFSFSTTYCVIHSPIRFDGIPMDMYNFLYISEYPEEWEMDNDDIQDGYAMAYVWNKTDDWMSEFGSIAVQERFGGLVRVS